MQDPALMRMLVFTAFARSSKQVCLKGFVVSAEWPFKCEELEAEHVEGRHPCCQKAHNPEQWEGCECLSKNFVLAPEAC